MANRFLLFLILISNLTFSQDTLTLLNGKFKLSEVQSMDLDFVHYKEVKKDGSLSKIKKKNVDLLLFYLCDMQCCMATVKDNLSKTASQVKDIITLADNLKVNVIFGGSGIHFLPDVSDLINNTFHKYSDLEKII